MLLLADDALPQRRAATAPGGPLAPLFDSLAAELAPWLGREPYVPAEKALLSRQGGRCEACGSVLEFDPASPRRHRCPACGRVHTGELHDRAWVMPYQLWLAERAVHGALFHLLRGEEAHARFARDTLAALAGRYIAYANVDNVLGPTRLFFSTYLESIWLLQVCMAADLLRAGGDARIADEVREKIIEPGSRLIAGYDEGASNRQVWNNAALIAAAGMLGRRDDLDRIAHGPSGVESHLSSALLPDGTWYEGENYHQFALRGLWYCVTMLEVAGVGLKQALRDRFQRAFAAPFVTAVPDFTMPSRKDSQYAVSLRQWRIAELTELGFARTRDATLASALATIYDGAVERRDTGRSRSTADVERNHPASALTRADLGWRALLHALPELPPLRKQPPRSALLEAQGYAVFRRDGDVYVGFECGQSGGGHGHPDRLNLTLYRGSERWLDDLGTGSYVDPSLHWYRSTLAHNAPLVNGKSQPLRDATLRAYDEREGLGWIVADFGIPGENVRLERTIVVAPDYLVDELRWEAPAEVQVDLPWHLALMPADAGEAATIAGGQEPKDGFEFLDNVRVLRDEQPPFRFRTREPRLHVAVDPSLGTPRVYLASAPGQPASTRHDMAIIRVSGARGWMRTVVAWGRDVEVHGERIHCGGDEYHEHRRDEQGWHVLLTAGGARSSIDLSGFRSVVPHDAPGAAPRTPIRLHRTAIGAAWLSDLRDRGHWLIHDLGESHYRPSEVPWKDAGSPAATIAIAADGERVVLLAAIRAGDQVFAAQDAVNPYDNEHPDTMRAGVQLYLGTDAGLHGWMLIPEGSGEGVRVRSLSGDADLLREAAWRRAGDSYELRVVLTPRTDTFALDVIINETVAGRERRRGQLVMSGARGEFVYLRGDRHDAARLIPMRVVP